MSIEQILGLFIFSIFIFLLLWLMFKDERPPQQSVDWLKNHSRYNS